MKSGLERFVENIVRHTDCSKEEKEDLYEELLIHLQMSRGQLMEDGLSKEEAEKKAMALFGNEGEIGSQIQQAMFPYRKELMFTLSVTSILYTVAAYCLQLFWEGNAFIMWMVVSMASSSFIFYLAVNKSVHLNRKRWINSTLVLHALIYLYGGMLSDGLSLTILPIAAGLVILLNLSLLYLTSLNSFGSSQALNRDSKIIHALNITAGIFIIGATLFIVGGSLIMIGGFSPIMLAFCLPALIWIGLYIAQVKALKKNKRLAYGLAVVPMLFIVGILLIAFLPKLMY
ncbi:hypothetical protein D0469_20555 [Peribacillus saganii]|uniref:Uncharacterized protein n=1 Tax=Peribacillus saganii TaxID=2303992 RepID=A0A372L9P9_9BACI|nr:permease prefix domain 1-containing protein [Peribacillus saganii]RFU62297.1 hypothetical protein D0469_20555 [Peribacillus saganii]